jgi:hypothetical protein
MRFGIFKLPPSAWAVSALLMLVGVSFWLAEFARSTTSPFKATELPTTLGMYHSVEYFDLTQQSLLFANGSAPYVHECHPFLVRSDGSNLRTLAVRPVMQGVFLPGFFSKSGAGYVLEGFFNRSELKIYSFDNAGAGRELSIWFNEGSSPVEQGVNAKGQLVISLDRGGGPSSHMLISPDGERQELPSRFSALELETLGPGSLLGFNTLIKAPPYVSPPAFLFDAQTNFEQRIDDAEIAAIASPNRLWLKDSARKLVWVRDRGVDSNKIKLIAQKVFATAEGGAFVNQVYDSNAAYIAPSLSVQTITCAFPAGTTARKYRNVAAVSHNNALIRFDDMKNGITLRSGHAIVSHSALNSGRSFCPVVSAVKTKQCKLRKLATNNFRLPKGAVKRCNFELRLFGELSRGSLPVTMILKRKNGRDRKHHLTARDGVLKVRQKIAENLFSISINAPRDGFRHYHARVVYIRME